MRLGVIAGSLVYMSGLYNSMCSLIFFLFHYGLLKDIEYSSLCYTVEPKLGVYQKTAKI